jgi:CheY-like chemotaxis protein
MNMPAANATFDATTARRPRLLLVEDDGTTREMLSSFLTGAGFDVAAAREPEEAAALLELRRYELLLSDLSLTALGRMEGLELLDQARYLRPDLKVVVHTGHSAPEVRVACEERGARDVVLKPHSLTDLAARLRRLLEEE